MKKYMLLRLFFIFIVFSRALPAHAQDLSSMNAVQLNAKGFSLYNEKKYKESLVYFQASFEQNPEYSYPHYNYACVLSILKRDKEQLREHLLKSFFLNPVFREKYFTDSDLEWFRSIPAKDMPNSEYFDFNRYNLGAGVELIKKYLVQGKKTLDYDVYSVDQFWGVFLSVNSSGGVRIWGAVQDVTGKYQIKGNLVYIELNEDFAIKTENGSFTFSKIILQCNSIDEYAVKIAGFALLPDSLWPFGIWIHIEGGV